MKNNTYHVFFGNLSNPLRVEIISALKEREMSVSDLSKRIKTEQSKLSHALANLRNCKIVNFKVRGKQRVYYLNKKTILPILKIIDCHAKSFCRGKCGLCESCSA